MAQHFHELTERLGWVYLSDGLTRVGAARLTLTPPDITVEIPLDDEICTTLGISPRPTSSNDQTEPPSRLVFVDQHGRVGLSHCRNSKSTFHFGGDKTPWLQIKARYAVELGARDQDYWSVSGMRSEIAGLASWSGLASVAIKHKLNEDQLINGMSVTAESQPLVAIGTADGLALKPHFSLQESRANGEFILTERVFLQTWVDDPAPWESHIRTHQSMQDLLTIAYWCACGQQMKAVSSSRYPLERIRSGEAIGEKWQDVFVDWHGRGSYLTPQVLPDRRVPLFYFDDLGPEGVKRWVSESEKWTRVVGPLSASRYQANHTVEVTILQVGISIEALGYEIALRKGLIPPGGNQKFPQYLARIEETIECDLSAALGGHSGIESFVTFNEWGSAFNAVYKEAKHADHPLPDPMRGWALAESGALLVRLWLAQEFGVERSKLEQQVNYQ